MEESDAEVVTMMANYVELLWEELREQSWPFFQFLIGVCIDAHKWTVK